MQENSYTKEFMQANCGCYELSRLNACSFMKADTITLQSIVESEISLKDKFWFVCWKVLTKEQNQKLAIEVAEIVLPIYEGKYPDSKAPREAIEAAKLYLSGHITFGELLAKRRAADAAAADAAAYAAAAAAVTYAAAAYAAYDAAYAAYAAYDAAYAAADAAVDAYTESLTTLLYSYCL